VQVIASSTAPFSLGTLLVGQLPSSYVPKEKGTSSSAITFLVGSFFVTPLLGPVSLLVRSVAVLRFWEHGYDGYVERMVSND
jgi:hypothetical protein